MSLLFPARCDFCGKPTTEDKPICKECFLKMPLISGNVCGRCGREYALCSCKIGDFAFVRNVSLYYYDGAVKQRIKRLKYYRRPQVALDIGEELAKFVSKAYASVDFDVVTYVPMYNFTKMRRGYNQSQLMAEPVAKKLGVSVAELVYKRFGMSPQKALGAQARRRNVRGKFYTTHDLRDKTVLIIDDIMTTGSTLSECALALRNAGAKAVYTATYAIAVKNN